MKVSVVIPAFNEEQGIGAVLAALRAECGDLVTETIVVDDGSSDGTARIAGEAPGVTVLGGAGNRGYGASLRRGIQEASGEYVITMDADGQHRAADVRKLIDALPGADMVVGQRTRLLHSPLWRMPGKWLLTAMASYLTQREIPDLNCGLRAMRREVVKKYLHVCPTGFSFSTTLTMAMLTRGHRVKFVPIDVAERVGVSTVNVRTGLQTILLVLRLAALFNPLRLFGPAAFVSFGVGVVWAIPYLLMGRGLAVASMLAIVTSVVLFALGIICDQISQLRLERYD